MALLRLAFKRLVAQRMLALALLITMSIIASPAPARVRLGAVILYLPLALHFAARLTRRVSPVPGCGPRTSSRHSSPATAVMWR